MGFIFGRDKARRQERYWGIGSTGDLIPRRTVGDVGVPYVDEASAMRHSAVWAAVRLRADLISSLPVSAYRLLDGMQVTAPLSPFMAGPRFMEFVYSSQSELDRTGNSIGIIKSVDGQGYPTDIELQSTSVCDVVIRDNQIRKYRINNVEYDPDAIWHEKQFTVSGLHVGLSPVSYAAFTLGQYRSVQEFAAQWFVSGNGPRASLKNVDKTLKPKEATIVKEAWRASQSMGEPFVHGRDWEYNLIQASQASTDWLEAMRYSNVDVARFFGVPADLLDAAMTGGPTITYANITQRNLQFLVMNLGPAIIRRENAFTQLLPRPRVVSLDQAALLRMDPTTRAAMIHTQIESRVLAPSEARALDNRRPFTPAQIEEFDDLGLNRRGSTPETSLAPQAGPDPVGPIVAAITPDAGSSAGTPDQGNDNNNG